MRLPYANRETAAPEVREALEALPDLNIFRMVAHAETAFRPWLALGGAILSALELDAVQRELAILQVAKLTDAEYEWVQHEAIARGVGASDDQIAAVRDGVLDRPSLSAAERAVLRFTAEVVEHHAASPAAVEELLALSSPRVVVELLLVVGHYTTVAFVAKTTGIEVDAPVQMAVVDAARRGDRTES